ncbi:MAG TPA: hypothetical protein VFG42_21120 [Baekduia sp.]|uniref:hypothetical protein n=1 Tax=Baekduia sp. TaxID=2600305 RepID=UPI002D782AC7|nr:hypothetical protein [Baekduia sp.]HET6509312.1 hypothetical protein [Baekduia sp.]
MRKFLIPTAAAAVLAVGVVEVSTTIAQDSGPTTIKVKATATPNNGGSKSKPQGHKVVAKITVTTAGDVDHPIVQSGDIYFPKGGKYQGEKYTKCASAVLTRGGPGACPTKSRIGEGSGSASADTVEAGPKVQIFNGGKNLILAYVTLQHPARVRAVVPAKLTPMSGQWSYKLHFDVPQTLQVVAGIPITLNNLTLTTGYTKAAKDIIATTSCGAGNKWPFQVNLSLDTHQSVSYTDSVACKK